MILNWLFRSEKRFCFTKIEEIHRRELVFSAMVKILLLEKNLSDLNFGKLEILIQKLSLQSHFSILPTPKQPLRKMCKYSEFFWSVFSRIRTEYGDLQALVCNFTKSSTPPWVFFTF